MKKRCPQCGHIYSAEFKFCQNDGADLVEVESSPSATVPLPNAKIAPRAVSAAAPATNSPPLIVGASVAVLVLLLGIAMFVSGNQNRQKAQEELLLAQQERAASSTSPATDTVSTAGDGSGEVTGEGGYTDEENANPTVEFPTIPVGTWKGKWPWIENDVPATLVITAQNGSSFDGVLTLFYQNGRSQIKVRGEANQDGTVQLNETEIVAQRYDWGELSSSAGKFASDWQQMSGQFSPTKSWWFRWTDADTSLPSVP